MARRGAALADVKTNEDLEELLKTECVHVLNVYDGFFGPCNSLASNLRDFKMIHAGDDLQVTTVNVDQIDVFRRFRNKSEPAYLMVANSRIVNSYYGTDIEELIDIIKEEILLYKSGDDTRETFDLREMSALEAHRFRTKRDEMIFNRKQDQMKKHQIVYDYRMKLTDNIMDNVSDTGVTVFMPHVLTPITNDLLVNLVEPAAQKNMHQKHYVTTEITKEDLEMINFDGENLSPILFNHIRDREVMIIAWKMASGELRPINEMFSDFAKFLREELEFEVAKPKGKGKKKGKGKSKKKKEVVVEEVKPEGEGEEEQLPPFKLPPLAVPLSTLKKGKADPIQIEPIDLQFIESEADIIKLVCESIKAHTEQSIVQLHNQCIKGALIELIDDTKNKEAENETEGKKKKKKVTKAPKIIAKGEVIYDPDDKEIAYVCPVWTPPTARSHASILYLYFRRLLSFFLPMDPPGASQYVTVVFNATRHEEILEFMKENAVHKANILAHGIFRGFVDGEDFANTQLVCKTGVEYRLGVQEPDDKIILKVVSNTDALLALVDLHPEFVSQNENDARMECDVIFPLGYVSISEEEAEADLMMDEMYGEKPADEEQPEDAPDGTDQPPLTGETASNIETESKPAENVSAPDGTETVSNIETESKPAENVSEEQNQIE